MLVMAIANQPKWLASAEKEVKMLYAVFKNKKIRATPKFNGAVCPNCLERVVAKCGHINIWHWAHESGFECDNWSEGESEWHLMWKSKFPSNWVEISIVKNSVRHRADVVLASGMVLELQHSPISFQDMAAREKFYGDMMWIFDVREAAAADPTENAYVGHEFIQRPKLPRLNLVGIGGNICDLYWAHPKKHIGYARKPVILDCGDQGLFAAAKLELDKKGISTVLSWGDDGRPTEVSYEAPCRGHGYVVSFDQIIRVYGKDILA